MKQPSFGSRLVLAFRVLFSGELAARLTHSDSEPALLSAGETTSVATTEEAPENAPPPEIEPEIDLTPALQLLSILQREGRFIDFLKEDMSGFSDEEIGAAARVVQEGCKRGLAEYVQVAPLRSEAEGAAITLDPGYDANETRVTGNVTGQPPYRGTLAHHGWRAASIRLPQLSTEHDARILAAAEVEV